MSGLGKWTFSLQIFN